MAARLLLLALVLAGPALADPSWISYRPPDGTFRVLLPGQPEISQDTSGSGDGITFDLMTEDLVYFAITRNDFRDPVADEASYFDGVVERLGSGKQVLRAEDVRVVGQPAREVVFDAGDHLEYVRVVLVGGRRLFLLSVYAAPDAGADADVWHFWESFQPVSESVQ